MNTSNPEDVFHQVNATVQFLLVFSNLSLTTSHRGGENPQKVTIMFWH